MLLAPINTDIILDHDQVAKELLISSIKRVSINCWRDQTGKARNMIIYSSTTVDLYSLVKQVN